MSDINFTFKGVARILGRGSAIWSEATDSATLGVGDKAPGRGLGMRSPPENFQDFMFILDPESTCKCKLALLQKAKQPFRV